MWDQVDRRVADRRQGERRAASRGGADRRQADRRMGRAGASVLAAAVALTALSAEAQIYTRRNSNGTVEATNVPDAADFRLTYIGKGTLIHSAAFRLRPNYNGEFNHHIDAAATLHGVSTELVRAVIQVESEFDPLARSSKGAQGLMQLMPDTARRMGVANALDPRQNIFGGVRYLRQLLDMFRGDVALTAAAYNAGENAVTRYGGVPPFRETRGYVQKVQSLLSGFVPSVQAASFITPTTGGIEAAVASIRASSPTAARRPVAAPARPARVTPARPRVFYKWTDAGGVVHVGQTPPSEGIVYTMIRALD
jgi:soluble lytic murein transglycosylase-like protein